MWPGVAAQIDPKVGSSLRVYAKQSSPAGIPSVACVFMIHCLPFFPQLIILTAVQSLTAPKIADCFSCTINPQLYTPIPEQFCRPCDLPANSTEQQLQALLLHPFTARQGDSFHHSWQRRNQSLLTPLQSTPALDEHRKRGDDSCLQTSLHTFANSSGWQRTPICFCKRSLACN